ncbi:MAG: dihydropteroate synthase [Nitrospina sp.]|jgi:dihydropteroate synthase|nr:dihydropteroate synthase [Nitrospina sp.]MBT4129007.1 dihydropteroate synthase [Nitrospina sp.]MBT7273369.1 dihydropteroate synthase [Nitrospina sp.]
MPFSFNNLASSNSTAIMGIINLSPDSFYSRSIPRSISSVFNVAKKMIQEGVHILDVGAETTRPGSKGISVKLELERLLPVITKLTKEFDIPISVDTYKPEVASVVLQEGVSVINDISGLGAGYKMANVIARHKAGVVLMHMKGTPETMQNKPYYKDVCAEVLNFLSSRIMLAEEAGIDFESIAIDPGIGFGKTLTHNVDLITKLDQLKVLGKQILLGVSRKSFIGDILNLEPAERLEGSIAAGIVGVINGANILRVHDVGSTMRAVRVVKALRKRI